MRRSRQDTPQSAVNAGCAKHDPAAARPAHRLSLTTVTGGVTFVQALHITQLRDAVNLVRARAGLAAASWTQRFP